MKKLLILFLFTSIAFAQSAGESGLSFLKIGFGARNIAMGDLGVVSADDITGAYYNPALMSKYEGPQISITHNQWIQDVTGEMLGASFELFGLPMGLNLNTTSVADIEVRTRPGEVQSTFNANYFFGSLATGFKFYENLSVGMSVKYLYESMFANDASGWGFDFGLYYTGLLENVNVGASLRNVGSMEDLRNEATELPTDFRIGASYDYELESITSDLFFNAGYQKYSSSDDNHIHLGAEFLYNDTFALRGGYITGYESKGLTTGAGITWQSINFDYAYTPFDYNLGNSHTISLMYTF